MVVQVLTSLLLAILLGGCALRPPNIVCIPAEVYQTKPISLEWPWEKTIRPVSDASSHGVLSTLPTNDGDTQTVMTANYANQRGGDVLFNFRYYGNAPSTRSVMRLLDAVQARLAKRGYENAPVGSGLRRQLLIGGDVTYSVEKRTWSRSDGNMMILVIDDKNKWTWENVRINKGLDRNYIEILADKIMARLEF